MPFPSAQASQFDVRRGSWLVRGGILVATAAVVALVFVVAQPRSTTPPLHASTPPLLALADAPPGTIPAAGGPAGAVFERLAEIAGRQTPSGSGPVQHVALSAWWSSNGDEDGESVTSVLEPVEVDSYFRSDGTMRLIERRGPPLDDEGRVESPRRGDTLTDESFENGDPGPGYADRLPVTPDPLRRALTKGYDQTTCHEALGACLMSDVVGLFAQYVVSPELTSALWRVLATEPSITHLGQVRDRLGRPAEAFTTPSRDGVSQDLLLISPTTAAYLGEEVVLVKPAEHYSFTPPAVLSFTALVSAERIPAANVPSAAQSGSAD